MNAPESPKREERKSTINLTLTSFMGNKPQFKLVLKKPVEVSMVYGFKKKVGMVYIKVDEPDLFFKMINAKLTNL
jgi:hypothetical protein